MGGWGRWLSWLGLGGGAPLYGGGALVTGGGGHGRGGVSPVEYFGEVVLPAVFEQLDRVFPEFGFVHDGRGGWVAKGSGAKGEHGPLGTRCDRVHARRLRSGDVPAGFGVHGGSPVPFTAWVLGQSHGSPRGSEFLRAAADLARRAGVDPGPLEGGGAAPVSPADLAAVRARYEAQRRESERRERRRRRAKIEEARAVWDAAVEGHPGVARYVAGRGVEVGDLPGGVPRSLRFCEETPVGRGKKRLPAVVAAVTLPAAEGGAGVVAVHRLFVNADGSGKSDELDSPKMMLGPVGGGAVRLGMPPEGGELVLCEGIETGLAIRAATGWAVWACLSAGGLLAVRLPAQVARMVRRVVVAGDLDDPHVKDDQGRTPLRGQRAAVEAAARLSEMFPGLETGVALPEAWAPEGWR